MVRKRFFGIISGTKSPRTKIFALFGSSYMTGPWANIKIFGVLGAFVDFKKRMILKALLEVGKGSIFLFCFELTYCYKTENKVIEAFAQSDMCSIDSTELNTMGGVWVSLHCVYCITCNVCKSVVVFCP